MIRDAYLLTRHWRDTPKGIDLSFWAISDKGPVKIIIESQQSVCFIEKQIELKLPSGAARKPLELKLLHGNAVDGLYFKQHRQLQQLRQLGAQLCESDIKPTDRFLMERFIRAGFRIEGDITPDNGFEITRNPRLSPIDFNPALKTVSLDIETRAHSRQLYSIAAATLGADENITAKAVDNSPLSDNSTIASHMLSTHPPSSVVFMVGTGKPEKRNGYTLIFCESEKALLEQFFDWLSAADPDVLVGWAVVNFDLNFLDQKCRALNIPFRLGRNNETAVVLQPGKAGSPRIARVPGRAVLDGIDQLKAGFWSFDSFSLDNVSHELLGTGKLISSDEDKIATINHLYQHEKAKLADYNLRDCTLVNEIFIKANLLAFARQRANLTGLALDRLGGSVASFDNLYLPKLHRHGYVAPDTREHGNAGTSPGGYVMDSMPGLYKNVLVLDFKSLYPSIIRTFFIDPLGLAVDDANPVPGFVEAKFSRQQHILPGLIEQLWAARDQAKLTQNAPLSQAIKIIMNSFYGVLGTTGCRFFSQQLASSITRRGHEIITQSRDWIKSQGYEVIYGDTDSVFVWVGDAMAAEQCQAIGKELMFGLNSWWQEQLQQRYDIASHLEVEFETHYLRFFMPTVRGMPTGSKKRYAGLSANSDGTLEQATLVVKGLEAARTDWTPLARHFQRELFNRVFHDKPFEGYVRDIAQALHKGELDEQLIYRKRIRRKLEEYQRNVPPHIQAAKKLNRNGSFIRYVITRNGPEPVDALESPIDYQHYQDKQLAPAADGILQFLDTGFSIITDAQMDMF